MSDPSVKEWERSLLMRVKHGRGSSKKREASEDLGYILGEKPVPEGSYPIVGLANFDDWAALRDSTAWKHLVAKDGGGRVDAATTLDRIDVNLARRLVARGYLNTYFASLFLAPLSDGEIDRLAGVDGRLDHIVGIGSDTKRID